MLEHPLCLQLEVLEFHDNRSSPFEDSTLLAALLEALGSLRPADGESLAQLLRGFDQVHRSPGQLLRGLKLTCKETNMVSLDGTPHSQHDQAPLNLLP